MNDRDGAALLKNELNRRMAVNQRYSLRAFARALKMDPSTLSKILGGRRKLGVKAWSRLLDRLGMGSEGSGDFYSSIGDQEFEKMPEWYDTAILEQLNVTGFKATKKSLATVFELNEIQIESALNRLKKLNLIKINKWGIAIDLTSGQTSNIQPAATTAARRNLQKQFLQKAIQSIDRDPIEDRDMTTITCATSPAKIAEAKVMIKRFRRELADFLTSSRKASRTYNVTIALYPLTRELKEER